MSSNTKKLIILVLVLLVLSFLFSVFLGIHTLGFAFGKIRISHGNEETFQIRDNFTNIDIKSKTGNIVLHKSDDNRAKVVWSGHKAVRLTSDTKNGTLKIREKYKFPWFLRPILRSGESEIIVYLPEKDYQSLNLENDTGVISILDNNFRFTGAEIETDTGAINLGQLTVTKDIKLSADTGRIQMTDIKCGGLSVENDTGQINLKNVLASGTMELETDTGSITLDRCDAGTIDIESDTGSVTASLLTNKMFSVKSDTGKINVPPSVSGGPCRIKTDTGSITVTIIEKQ